MVKDKNIKFTSGRYQEHSMFWRQKLSAVEQEFIFRAPSRNNSEPAAKREREELTFAQQTSEIISGLTKNHETGKFVLLLSALNIAISKYSDHRVISIKTPLMVRREAIAQADDEVILVERIDPTLSLKEFTAGVKETVSQSYKFQNFPLDVIFNAAQLKTKSGTNIFLYSPQLHQHPENLERYELVIETASTDGCMSGLVFTYDTEWFDEQFIRSFGKVIENALKEYQHPARSLRQLDLLSPEDRQHLVDYNKTQADFPQHKFLQQLFEEQVERTPDRIAVSFEERELTYRQLDQQANGIAQYLRDSFDVKPDDLVGIMISRSELIASGLLGILKSGAAYVPIDPEYPKNRIEYILRDAQLKALIADSESLPAAGNYQGKLFVLDADAIPASTQIVTSTNVQVSNHLAYVIYTSGSTGQPKGVQITHHAVVNFLHSMRQSPGLSEQDVLLAVTPLSFDIAALEIFLPLIVGAKVVVVPYFDSLDGVRLAHQLARTAATTMQATPATWRMLLESGWQGNPHLRVLCGGEALPIKLAAQLLEKSQALWNLYGPTETTIWSTFSRVTKNDSRITLGRPIANTQVYVLDAQLQPVPIGVTGHLHIGGVGLARGYLNRPELTAQHFIPNPLSRHHGARLYRTGDLARYLPDGQLEFVGRADTQVKVRGFRIELGEIEAVLAAHRGVSEAVVVAHEVTTGERRLVAYIVGTPESTATAAQLREHLREQLPEYMVPSLFIALEQLPLTPNGKIDRRALPAPDAEQGLSAAYVAPRDEAEQRLAQMWAEVLGVERVSVEANFFEIGGHSLLATQIISRVREGFEVEIGLQSLFRAPTVRGLMELIGEARATAAGSHLERIATLLNSLEQPLVHLQPAGDLSPFFCVHPTGGNVYSYTKLAQCLGTDRPFISIQASSSAIDTDSGEQIEIVAEQYIGEIRAYQPEGPYFLGGWSIGGLIAFEMSRRLQARGQQVAFLGLIDSSLAVEGEDEPDNVTLLLSFAADTGLPIKNLDISLAEISKLTPSEMLAEILRLGKQFEILPAGFGMEELAERYELFKNKVKAMKSYVPAPSPTRATLFLAANNDEALRVKMLSRWQVVTAGELETYMVPGSHHDILREPHVSILADHLKACLQHAQASIEDSSSTSG